jgi:hypothetical protein
LSVDETTVRAIQLYHIRPVCASKGWFEATTAGSTTE